MSVPPAIEVAGTTDPSGPIDGVFDGMNETGLVANLLYLGESDFGPAPADNRPRLSFAGWVDYVLTSFSTVNEVVDGWMTSDGHCANIMNAAFVDIGVACVPGGTATAYRTSTGSPERRPPNWVVWHRSHVTDPVTSGVPLRNQSLGCVQTCSTTQVGTGHVGTGQVGTGQVGIGQVGIGQVGTGQVGIGQGGPGQVGKGQVGKGQVGTGQVGKGQDDTG